MFVTAEELILKNKKALKTNFGALHTKHLPTHSVHPSPWPIQCRGFGRRLKTSFIERRRAISAAYWITCCES